MNWATYPGNCIKIQLKKKQPTDWKKLLLTSQASNPKALTTDNVSLTSNKRQITYPKQLIKDKQLIPLHYNGI